MAAFVLSVIVNEYPIGQVSAIVYCYLKALFNKWSTYSRRHQDFWNHWAKGVWCAQWLSVSLCNDHLVTCTHLYSQEACVQGNLIAICLEQLTDPYPPLRQWLAICLGRVWFNYEAARWCAVRDSAPDKLYCLLSDPLPEVRDMTMCYSRKYPYMYLSYKGFFGFPPRIGGAHG